MADELYLLTADDVAFLRALRRKLDNVRGPAVLRNDGGGIIIGGGPPGKPHIPEDDDDFFGWFYITSYTQDGTNLRWEYVMQRYKKNDVGYGEWVPDTDRPGIPDPSVAYNTMENGNAATGTMGTGVILDGTGVVAGTNYTLGPIPVYLGGSVGWPHRVYRVPAEVEGGYEYWFAAWNPLIGTCE